MGQYTRELSVEFKRNRKLIKARDDTCGICGRIVDKDLKPPDPFAPAIDHIKPVAKGGSDSMDNLQLTHAICNNTKKDKEFFEYEKHLINPRNLPQVCEIL